jgi:hypothetical protein
MTFPFEFSQSCFSALVRFCPLSYPEKNSLTDLIEVKVILAKRRTSASSRREKLARQRERSVEVSSWRWLIISRCISTEREGMEIFVVDG